MSVTVEYRIRSNAAFGGPIKQVYTGEALTDEERLSLESYKALHKEYLSHRVHEQDNYAPLMEFELRMPRLESMRIYENGLALRWKIYNEVLSRDQIFAELRDMSARLLATVEQFAEYDRQLKQLNDNLLHTWRIYTNQPNNPFTAVLPRALHERIMQFKQIQREDILRRGVQWGDGARTYFSERDFRLCAFKIENPVAYFPQFSDGGVKTIWLNYSTVEELGVQLNEVMASWVGTVAAWPAYKELLAKTREEFDQQKKAWELAEDERWRKQGEEDQKMRQSLTGRIQGGNFHGRLADMLIAASGLVPDPRYNADVRQLRHQASIGMPWQEGSYVALNLDRIVASEYLYSVSVKQRENGEDVRWRGIVMMLYDGTMRLVPGSICNGDRPWPKLVIEQVEKLFKQMEDC